MSAADFPTGRIWIPVTDLPSALDALELLTNVQRRPPPPPPGEDRI